MINFAVINIKSAIKNFSKIIIVLFLIIGIVNISDVIKNNDLGLSYIDLVKSCISFDFENNKNNSLEKIILYQEMPILAASHNIDFSEENASSENIESNSDTEIETSNESASETEESETDLVSNNEETESLRNLSTEVISENNISESYNTIYGSVKIKNETSFVLNNEVLTPNVEFTNKTDIVIFHTHTCESYTPTEANNYVASRKF